MTVLIPSHSAAMVRLRSHMDPRSAILLDETIHTIDCPVHHMSVRHGGERVIHLSYRKQAPNNEGASMKHRE